MQVVSPEFTAALAESHRLATRVTVVSPEGAATDLPIADGSVTLDINSAIRASVSLTLAVDDADLPALVPDNEDSLLAPYGNEIQVFRGVKRFAVIETASATGGNLLPGDDVLPASDLYPGATEITWSDPVYGYTDEMVPLGIFRLDETETEDRGDLGINVTGYDRSSIIIDAVFENPGQVPRFSYGVDVILGLIRDGWQPEAAGTFEPAAYPEVELADDAQWTREAVPTTLPLLAWEAGDDRWDFCQGVAEACNCRLYFNSVGQLRLRSEQTSDQEAALEISEGEDGILLGASKRWGREDAVNRVVVTGENNGEDPIVKDARDEDPASPTHYGGPFGKVTFFYSTEFLPDPDVAIDSEAQVQQVAQKILSQKLGTGQQIGFDALVHPALEPLDTILINRERMGITRELHIVDSLTIPLGYEGGMSGTTRVKRVESF